jgi:hypothetical protein
VRHFGRQAEDRRLPRWRRGRTLVEPKDKTQKHKKQYANANVSMNVGAGDLISGC